MDSKQKEKCLCTSMRNACNKEQYKLGQTQHEKVKEKETKRGKKISIKLFSQLI